MPNLAAHHLFGKFAQAALEFSPKEYPLDGTGGRKDAGQAKTGKNAVSYSQQKIGKKA
jgi:hypothetical protein